MKVAFAAHSKKLFYFKAHISKFILEKGLVPINPFMNFQYFMLDTVDRNAIRNGNNALIKKSDELWVFGAISDGVLEEIRLAKQLEMSIKYFKVVDSKDIVEISKDEVEFEEGLDTFRHEL